MDKRLKLVSVAVLAALTMTGCASSSEDAHGDGVWGYVASADDAQLEVAPRQTDDGELLVARALAPENAWVVVHSDDNGAPGERVGVVHVAEGESTDVRVALEGVTTPDVIVAVHADRGSEGEFEFDMMDKETSPDRPFFVDGKELAAIVTVR